MDSGRWRDVERVLDLTLDSHPDGWTAILDEECSGDPELRREVEALLGRYASARRFLDSPPAAAAAALIKEAQSVADTREVKRIGVYRIVRQIGRGGTSLVFHAQRDDGQFSQQVALKLLHPGHDSEIDQGRFRAERQILASLNHPNIARLLDGGLAEDGRPYLVMELVDGEPIDRYCDSKSLSLSQRLAMFITVAEATQYAHRNLVVHRDLKPSNILVTRDGQVKLLDFGLAKLLEPSASEAKPVTTQRWMTPEYAAPEQVRGQPATTLTDVYQLGAVLHELLTGKLPFGTRHQNAYELERAILEREPVPPSVVASQPSLRGDLDAIVLKALRKEPEQRYASAQELADDVRNRLFGYPVLARKQTAVYRARRYVTRHRWGLAASAVVLLTICAYAVTATVQRARTERALARATLEAQKAEKVTDLMLGIFEASERGRAFSDTVTARALMDRGIARARALTDEPLVRGQMLDVIGRMYAQLGDYEKAIAMFTEALAVRRQALGNTHVDVAATLQQLGDAANARGDFATAASVYREARTIRDAALGPGNALTLESLYWLAHSMHEAGDHAGARPLQDEWSRAVLRLPLEVSETRADQLINLAQIQEFRGEVLIAEQLFRRVVETRVALLGPRHPDVGVALHHVGMSLRAQKKLLEAERVQRQGVAILRAAYPDGHLDLGKALRSLALTVERQHRPAEAESMYVEVERIYRRYHGDGHTFVAVAMEDLGQLHRTQRNFARAEPYLRGAERIYLTRFGSNSLMAIRTQIALADIMRERGELAPAESLLLYGYGNFRDRRMPGGWVAQRLALESLVKLYETQGRESEAAKYRVLRDSLPSLQTP